MKRHQFKQQIQRNLTTAPILGLLKRSGVKLLDPDEQSIIERKVVGVNAAGEMREALSGGYGVERVETLPDGNAQAHLARVSGLAYPQ